jgi:hypothetical protein
MKKVDSLSMDILNLKIPNNAGMIDTAVLTLSGEIQIIATELEKLKRHQMSDTEGIVIRKSLIVDSPCISFIRFQSYYAPAVFNSYSCLLALSLILSTSSLISLFLSLFLFFSVSLSLSFFPSLLPFH